MSPHSGSTFYVMRTILASEKTRGYEGIARFNNYITVKFYRMLKYLGTYSHCRKKQQVFMMLRMQIIISLNLAFYAIHETLLATRLSGVLRIKIDL